MTTGKDLESPFGIEEMFYSKTDSKGIITAGNKVFVRVSEFSENELLRSPHNIIRHHEMPRSVFKVFWNFLKAGKPVAAYVKNRSKHGRFYWVLAMAFPIETGYLSIRLKPTSPLFSRAEDIYERVLSAERQGITLEDGINLIKDNLRSIGFSSYEDFMKIALIKERVQSVLVSFHQTGRLFERINEMIADSKVITETSEKVKYLTLNMTVASAKLGEKGKPLCVVAGNLEKLTDEILQAADQFKTIFLSYRQSVIDIYFSIATSRFQIEIVRQLNKENALANYSEESLEAEASVLFKLVEDNFDTVSRSSENLIKASGYLLNSLERLSKINSGMEVLHIMAKIEMSRSTEAVESLAWRIAEMENLVTVFKNVVSTLQKNTSAGLSNALDLAKINSRMALELRSSTDK